MKFLELFDCNIILLLIENYTNFKPIYFHHLGTLRKVHNLEFLPCQILRFCSAIKKKKNESDIKK